MTTITVSYHIPYDQWCCGNCSQKVGIRCLSEDGIVRGFVFSDGVSACRVLPLYFVDKGFVVKSFKKEDKTQ